MVLVSKQILNNQNKNMKKLSIEEQEALGTKIKLIWGFIWSLKPYRDVIGALAKNAEDRAKFIVSAAVLDPFGYELEAKKQERVAKRAKLLIEMIDCLEETDKEVLNAEKDKEEREKMGDIFNF